MWETVQLGDVCEVLDKLRKPITKKDRVAGDYPYYGATGIVDWVADYIFEEPLVLIGEDGAKWEAGAQTAFIADGKYWVNNHAHVVKPHADKMLNEWLAYFLSGLDLKPWVTGLTVPKLNQAQLKLIPIPLPPLAEQQRIVTKLDAAFAEIDTAIAAAEKNAENAEALYQLTLTSLMTQTTETWEIKKFREACSFEQGVQVPVGEQSEIKNDTHDTRFLRIIDFTQGTEEPRFIKRERNRQLFSKDDIALVRYGASTGFVCTALEGLIANNMFKVTPKDGLFENDYLKYFLSSSVFKNFINSKIGGAAMPAINFGMFDDFEIAFPKAAEERKIIVNTADKALQIKNRLLELYSQKSLALCALKSSLLAAELTQQSEAA